MENNYNNWSINDMLEECRFRGFLTHDNKYIKPRLTENQERLRSNINNFKKRYNINDDQLMALIDLVENNKNMRLKLLEIIENS